MQNICFGGYCGELAFMDEKIIISGKGAFHVNGANARNDILALVEQGFVHVTPAEEASLKLNSVEGARLVNDLFLKHGQPTYRLMLENRKRMLDIAEVLYKIWMANEFRETIVRNSGKP